MGHSEISCSYCTYKKNNKIAPSHHVSMHVEFVEVHPKRKFRVIHILPFSNLNKCKRKSESIHGIEQSEKNCITSSSTETNMENGSSHHKWKNKLNCLWCCCGNRDSLIPKFSFLIKYAENVSRVIVSEAVHLVSCWKGSGASSKSSRSSRRSFHCVNLECLNSEPENSTSRLKADVKNSSSQNSSAVPVFNASRKGTLSKRLNSLIFFIHGLGGSADLWHYQLTFFSSQGYEVVAFDLLGHGMSSAPNDQGMYTFSEMLSDLLLIFDLYAKQRNVVVGHSYGCAFASSLCEKRHHAVKQLILISGGGPRPLEPRQGLSVFLPVCGLSLLKFLTCYSSRSGTEQEGSSHLMELIRISALPRYILKYVLQGQRWEEGDRLFYRSLYCPALLIYGSRDYFVSLHDEIEMEKTMPYAKLEVISNAGHSVMVDTPNELNELIFKFLLSWET